MSDTNYGAQAAYAKQVQFQGYPGTGTDAAHAAPDDRLTTRIHQRARKHFQEVSELAANVKLVADQLFGMEPMPEHPSAKGDPFQGGLEPARPQFDMIEREQFMVDEALETLRRQLSRFGNI